MKNVIIAIVIGVFILGIILYIIPSNDNSFGAISREWNIGTGGTVYFESVATTSPAIMLVNSTATPNYIKICNQGNDAVGDFGIGYYLLAATDTDLMAGTHISLASGTCDSFHPYEYLWRGGIFGLSAGTTSFLVICDDGGGNACQ